MRTCSVEIMAQEGTRDYLAIAKGRGFVYAYENQLYNRVKTEGRTKYLKCCKVGCDGSAKIIGDLFFLGYVHFCVIILLLSSRIFQLYVIGLAMCSCIFQLYTYKPGELFPHFSVIYT